MDDLTSIAVSKTTKAHIDRLKLDTEASLKHEFKTYDDFIVYLLCKAGGV